MSVGARALPDFESPPVFEVVLSTQFDPLPKFGVEHFGLYWSLVKDIYPRVETHSPIPSIFERFGEQPQLPTVRFELVDQSTQPRTWFLNDSGTEIVQLQNDRFIHNWRKVKTGDTYPRYEYLRDQYKKELIQFSAFLTSNGLGKLNPNQCEITYINHIELGTSVLSHGHASEVLSLLARSSMGPDVESEAMRLGARFRFSNKIASKVPAGRLHVDFTPAASDDSKQPLFVLNLTARGSPFTPDMDGVFAFFDRGRDVIVNSFANMTTKKMHSLWRRKT